MKKFGISCAALLFAVLLSFGVFFPSFAARSYARAAEGSNVQTAAEDEEELVVPDEVLDYVAITQDGYVSGQSVGYSFAKTDFQTVEVSGRRQLALFSNRTVSVTCTADFAAMPLSTNSYSISVGGTYIIENNAISDLESPYLKQIAGKNHVVFGAATEEQKTTDIYIRLRLEDHAQPIEFRFVLIQTNISLLSHNVQWAYTVEHGVQTVDAPTDGCTYTPITLTIPNGTELNPVFVKFVYCGETFEVYNVGGQYYNANDGEELSFSTLIFDVSGTYTVEIYDRTHTTAYPGSNYRVSHFVIVNQSSPLETFYFDAHTTSGQIIMNDQFCNEDVELSLVNLGNIRDYVQQIVVTRQYRSSSGRDVNEVHSYGMNEIESETMSFDQDGIYRVNVNLDIGGQTQQKSFSFTLLKDIRTQLTVDGVEYKTDLVNRAVTIPITRNTPTSYASKTCPVSSVSFYSFTITVANSNPSISGVNNNARSNDDVSITVHGVGQIQVTYTENGKTTTRTCKDGDRLPTFTQSGKYFIKITDEMGSTITKSFTINIKLNTAALILIIIAAVTAVLVIVFIIISRMKVKVR